MFPQIIPNCCSQRCPNYLSPPPREVGVSWEIGLPYCIRRVDCSQLPKVQDGSPLVIVFHLQRQMPAIPPMALPHVISSLHSVWHPSPAPYTGSFARDHLRGLSFCPFSPNGCFFPFRKFNIFIPRHPSFRECKPR